MHTDNHVRKKRKNKLINFLIGTEDKETYKNKNILPL